MSGVEAIFGMAASGAGLVSLGIQLGESAVKLRRIYHAAKDAPRTVSRLVFGLETMAMALRELEQHRQQNSHSGALLARCITECQQSTAEIQQLVDKVDDHLAKHARISGKVYAAFKERDMKELLDDLEKAKSSLELAYMMYLAEEQRRRDQAHGNTLSLHGALLRGLQAQVSAGNASISQQLTLLTQFSTSQQQPYMFISETQTTTASELMSARSHNFDTAEKSDCLERVSQCNRSLPVKQVKRKNGKTRFRASFRLPTWLCRRVWEFTVTHAQCSWSMHLRTYNIAPENSLIFHYCQTGDLAKVRRLIESGEATPLDVVMLNEDEAGSWWTLLEAAAQSGQLEICRYLLGQTTWPDHATILNNALGWFAGKSDDSESCAEMYRIFIGNPGFDADLDNNFRYRWLYYCDSTESLDVILQNQFSGFDSRPVEARFELASRIASIGAPGFLRCIGLRPSDRRLASLRNSSGASVLHCVARHLWYIAYIGFPSKELQEWLDIGVSVLKSGADPCSIADEKEDKWLAYQTGSRFVGHEQEVWPTTPLLDCVEISCWRMKRDGKAWFSQTLDTIRIWAEMIQRAGLDLCDYGAKESEVWKSLGVQDYSKFEHILRQWYQPTKIEQLVYGSTPIDWSLKTCHFWRHYVYRLRPPPGAFTEKHDLPATIAWLPTKKEENEGPWTLVESKDLASKDVDLRDSLSHSREPFNKLVDDPQDDSGVIMLMQYRASRTPSAVSRSHSQPPYLRRREVAYYAVQSSHRRLWLTGYHLCPFDFRWRFGCVGEPPWRFGWLTQEERYDSHLKLNDNASWNVFHVRSCAKGIFQGRSSAQESRYWQRHSFLAYVTYCQDNDNRNWFRNDVESLRHTGNRHCPHGCRKVYMDRLNVPEPLRHYHPSRSFEDEDDYRDDDADDHNDDV